MTKKEKLEFLIKEKTGRIEACNKKIEWLKANDSPRLQSRIEMKENLESELAYLKKEYSQIKKDKDQSFVKTKNLLIYELDIKLIRKFRAIAKLEGLKQADLFKKIMIRYSLFKKDDFSRIKKILSIKHNKNYTDRMVFDELINTWREKNEYGFEKEPGKEMF